MFLTQLTTNIFLFIIGLLGIVLNRRNILIILMCVELVLLSLNLNFIIFSVYFDDLYGQLFSLFYFNSRCCRVCSWLGYYYYLLSNSW